MKHLFAQTACLTLLGLLPLTPIKTKAQPAIAIGTTDCGSIEILFDESVLNVKGGVNDSDWGTSLYEVKLSTLENQVWSASQLNPSDPLEGDDLGPINFVIACGIYNEVLDLNVYQITEADFWVEHMEERGTTSDGTPLVWEWAFSGFGGGIESYLLQELEGEDEILVEETLVNCELPPAPDDCGNEPIGTPPLIVCPEEMEINCGGEVNLVTHVLELDGDTDGPVVVSWFIDGELSTIQTVDAGEEPLPVAWAVQLNTGEHLVEVIAEDNDGLDACSFTITIGSNSGELALLTNAPETMLPREAPLSFEVWLDEGQEGDILIGTPDCYAVKKDQSIVNKSDSCSVSASGTTVSILDAGGVGNHIVIPVTAIDSCGNEINTEIVITVLRPANEGVGNGVDGNTKGHLHNGGNDDPEYSPGNPGAKNKKRS